MQKLEQLEKLYPGISDKAIRAETLLKKSGGTKQIEQGDLDDAAVNLRKFGEKIAQKICEKNKIKFDLMENSYKDYEDLFTARRLAPDFVVRNLKILRHEGNKGAHTDGETVTLSSANRGMQAAMAIAQWLVDEHQKANLAPSKPTAPALGAGGSGSSTTKKPGAPAQPATGSDKPSPSPSSTKIQSTKQASRASILAAQSRERDFNRRRRTQPAAATGQEYASNSSTPQKPSRIDQSQGSGKGKATSNEGKKPASYKAPEKKYGKSPEKSHAALALGKSPSSTTAVIAGLIGLVLLAALVSVWRGSTDLNDAGKSTPAPSASQTEKNKSSSAGMDYISGIKMGSYTKGDVRFSRRIDEKYAFEYPVENFGVEVFYNGNSATGKTIGIGITKSGKSMGNCKPIEIKDSSGSVSCIWQTLNVQPGNYFVEVRSFYKTHYAKFSVSRPADKETPRNPYKIPETFKSSRTNDHNITNTKQPTTNTRQSTLTKPRYGNDCLLPNGSVARLSESECDSRMGIYSPH